MAEANPALETLCIVSLPKMMGTVQHKYRADRNYSKTLNKAERSIGQYENTLASTGKSSTCALIQCLQEQNFTSPHRQGRKHNNSDAVPR
jgi:hypothetical protein